MAALIDFRQYVNVYVKYVCTYATWLKINLLTFKSVTSRIEARYTFF